MTFKNAPCGSIIVDMTDSETVSDDWKVGPKGDFLSDQILGELISNKRNDQKSPKQSIGLETGHRKGLLLKTVRIRLNRRLHQMPSILGHLHHAQGNRHFSGIRNGSVAQVPVVLQENTW